ncbi:hypothetical protein IFR05_005455 [Cadophora sp. M221]|nr:hypothetical protein IFR05_005455 [Cadophora sp. M221]
MEFTVDWNQIDIRRICQTQWSFLAPVFDFTGNAAFYDFDDNCVLPFIEDSETSTLSSGKRSKESITSSSRKVIIHPAHLRISDSGMHNRSEFVVNQLPENDMGKYMRFEVEKLKEVSHKHMISILAAFKLASILADDSFTTFARNSLLGHISMRRNANALKSIHGGGVFWVCGYHGNIKPENILWFSQNSDPGLLVLGDFGERKDPTLRPLEEQLRNSQAFDVWNLGCIFLEFATWFIDNREASLELFIQESIRVWIEGLIQMRRISPVMNDFLDMIAEGMLLENPQKWMSVADVNRALQRIATKASAEGGIEQGPERDDPKSRAPNLFDRFPEQPPPTRESIKPGIPRRPLRRQHELS